ncbi:uncharacterized protein GGS22DRAFT_31289 [Annulohypoxylon maeteangense]|uniref:uncharacterized protein n=1 Tax=Annulohypoxylon maeteangense TaxID=1927788 RepID=UPI002007E358|nr:uncharacterized protein GGS22DRAFT_31289 [Annulohypoxylon maeteangense]KAI0883482.1 hypothetical protein GGS22DRAFT_31289 [Annulohypoxylon maeteangense]
MQRTSQSSQTPNRRRQGGRHRNTPKSTTYASENDVSSLKSQVVGGSPDTPVQDSRKSQRASSTSQKSRNNKKTKKPKAKDAAEAFNSSKSDRTSPLLQPKNNDVPIFAGSTFHASPAPSELPIPSFFNTSAVDTPQTMKTKTTMSSPEQGLSCPTTDTEGTRSPSPESIPRAEDSPLELLFRADRAEKARVRRASSAHAEANTPSPFSPPLETHSYSAKEYSDFPTATIPSHMRRPAANLKRPGSMGISADELDGDPRLPVGPAFSTPFHERMRAVRSNHISTPSALVNQDTSSSDDLKRYLLTGRLSRDDEPVKQLSDSARQIPEQASPPFHRRLHHPDLPRRMPRGMFPASVLAGNVRTGQPSVSPVQANLANYQADQISSMEDSLRRVLKLDSPSQSVSLR